MCGARFAPWARSEHDAVMVRAVLSWVFPLSAILAIGPLAAAPLGGLTTPGGLPFASPLTSGSLIAGLLAGAVPLVVTAALALLASRLVDRRCGYLTAACVLLWGAWRTGPLFETLQSLPAASAMVRLAIEGLLVGAFVWGMALVIEAAAPLDHRRATHADGEPLPVGSALRRTLVGFSGWAAVLGSMAGAAVVVWFIAIEPLKNQALLATLLGGVAAGAVGRLAGQAMGGEGGGDPPASSAFLGVALLAALGPMWAFVEHGSNLALAARLDLIAKLSGPMPFDWVAGACLGVPLGRSWAASSATSTQAVAAPRGGGPGRPKAVATGR